MLMDYSYSYIKGQTTYCPFIDTDVALLIRLIAIKIFYVYSLLFWNGSLKTCRYVYEFGANANLQVSNACCFFAVTSTPNYDILQLVRMNKLCSGWSTIIKGQTADTNFKMCAVIIMFLQNTDASLIPTISWPAFAIHEEKLVQRTVDKALRKLKGRYGLKRFLRDGYGTVVEDKGRKYYKPAEIKVICIARLNIH